MLFTLQDPASAGNFEGYDDDTVLIIDSDRCSVAEIEKARRYNYDAPVTFNIGMILFYLMGMAGGIWVALLLDSWAPRAAAHWAAAYLALGAVAYCGYNIRRHSRLIIGEFMIRRAPLDNVRAVYWDEPIMSKLRDELGDDWPWTRRTLLNHKSAYSGAITFAVENYAKEFYGAYSRKAEGISWTPEAAAQGMKAFDAAVKETVAAIRAVSRRQSEVNNIVDSQWRVQRDALDARESAKKGVMDESYQEVGTKIAALMAASRTSAETTI